MERAGHKGGSAHVVPDDARPRSRVMKLFFPRGAPQAHCTAATGECIRVWGLEQAQEEADIHRRLFAAAPLAVVRMYSAHAEVVAVPDLPVEARSAWAKNGHKGAAVLRFQFGGPDLHRVATVHADVSTQAVLTAFEGLFHNLAPLRDSGLFHNDITVRNVVRCPSTGVLRVIDCALGGDGAAMAAWMHCTHMPNYDFWPREYRLYRCRWFNKALCTPEFLYEDWEPRGSAAAVARYLERATGSPAPFHQADAKELRRVLGAISPDNGYPGPASPAPFSPDAMQRVDVYMAGFTALFFLAMRAASSSFRASEDTLVVLRAMCALNPMDRPTFTLAAQALARARHAAGGRARARVHTQPHPLAPGRRPVHPTKDGVGDVAASTRSGSRDVPLPVPAPPPTGAGVHKQRRARQGAHVLAALHAQGHR